LAYLDLLEHWSEDKLAKILDRDGVRIGKISEDDNVAGRDVSELAVVVGKSQGIFRLAVNNDHPLAG
jgi:hypothetical protein